MTRAPTISEPDLIRKPPYPWFGGKEAIADLVWSRFGQVTNLVEPFFGGGAVLRARPQPFEGTETVNDANGFLINFWRSVQSDPEAVAHHADWIVSELCLHSRGDSLFYRTTPSKCCSTTTAEFIEKMRSDPEWFCPRCAGWWVWGQCCWIGSGWGPRANAGQGVNRQLPHLGNAGRGVNRDSPLLEYILALSARMRRVRVCCGDWSRVCGPTPTVKLGLTAVFLDPPYSAEDRAELYGTEEDFTVAQKVREWAIEWGNDPRIRIALCGYSADYDMPRGWTFEDWKAKGGYGSQGEGRGRANAHRERVWFSPYCLKDMSMPLFERLEER